MSQTVQITVVPEKKDDLEWHLNLISQKLNANSLSASSVKLIKRSIDARKREIKYILSYQILDDTSIDNHVFSPGYLNVSNAKETVHIIGCGPAGLFAALNCLKLGLKPIVFAVSYTHLTLPTILLV